MTIKHTRVNNILAENDSEISSKFEEVKENQMKLRVAITLKKQQLLLLTLLST